MDLITPLASSCRVATPHDSVLNSECAYTFHTPYSTDAGIVVNLTTHVGTVDALALAGGSSDPSEGLFVRIVKKRVEKMKTDDDGGDLHLVGARGRHSLNRWIGIVMPSDGKHQSASNTHRRQSVHHAAPHATR